MGVKLQSSSGGSVEIAAPVTASNYVLTAPAANGTILNDASSLAATNLTGNVDVARLVSAFSGSNVSLSSSGYQKLPSGLIIQWGSGSLVTLNASSISQIITFPISFPTGMLFAVCSSSLSARNTNNQTHQVSLSGSTNSQLNIYITSNVAGADVIVPVYLAIGR